MASYGFPGNITASGVVTASGGVTASGVVTASGGVTTSSINASGGTVGIGTASAAGILDIYDQNSLGINFYEYNNSGTAAYITMKSAAGTPATPAVLTVGASVGGIRGCGPSFSSGSFTNWGYPCGTVEFVVESLSFSSAYCVGGIKFLTGPGITAPTEKMRLNNGGQLLLGSSSAITSDAKLQIKGNQNEVQIWTWCSGTVSAGTLVGIINCTGYGTSDWLSAAGGALQFMAEEDYTDTNGGTCLQFWTTPQGTVAQVENMRLTGAGRLGIGTVNPIGQLGVVSSYGAESNTPTLAISDTSGRNVLFSPNATSAGSYNPHTVTNDSTLISQGTVVNTGAIVVAPWNTGYTGLRIASTANTFVGGANTFSFVSNTAGTAMVTVTGTGNVGIGTVTPGYPLDIYATLPSDNVMRITNTSTTGLAAIYYKSSGVSFTAGVGGASAPNTNMQNRFCVTSAPGTGGTVGTYLTTTATTWSAFSDGRLKNIIEPISNALSSITKINPVIYYFKNESPTTRRSGVIAQDVLSVFPEAVDIPDNPDGYYGVRYTELVPLCLAGIKELQTRLTTLEARLAALEAK
jgi:Chaperone of endosialidase